MITADSKPSTTIDGELMVHSPETESAKQRPDVSDMSSGHCQLGESHLNA